MAGRSRGSGLARGEPGGDLISSRDAFLGRFEWPFSGGVVMGERRTGGGIGRLWGVPVHRRLGGPCRDRIRIYPSAKAHKAPPGDVYGHSGDPPDIRKMVAMVKQAREQVGPDGAVMFDAHCAVPPAALI